MLVAGVVHTPSSKQQAQLRTLIKNTRPDVVLLELDQERLDLLIQRGGSFYGGELAAAAAEAANVDSVVLLGDLRARDFFREFRQLSELDLDRLRRAARLAFSRPWASAAVSNINVAATLVDDPAKIAPLAASVLATVVTGVSIAAGGATGQSDGIVSLLLLTAQVLLLLRFVDVLLIQCAIANTVAHSVAHILTHTVVHTVVHTVAQARRCSGGLQPPCALDRHRPQERPAAAAAVDVRDGALAP